MQGCFSLLGDAAASASPAAFSPTGQGDAQTPLGSSSRKRLREQLESHVSGVDPASARYLAGP